MYILTKKNLRRRKRLFIKIKKKFSRQGTDDKTMKGKINLMQIYDSISVRIFFVQKVFKFFFLFLFSFFITLSFIWILQTNFVSVQWKQFIFLYLYREIDNILQSALYRFNSHWWRFFIFQKTESKTCED